MRIYIDVHSSHSDETKERGLDAQRGRNNERGVHTMSVWHSYFTRE